MASGCPMDLLRIASSSPMNLLCIAALLGGAAAASPWNFGQGSSNAATRAALESFQSDGFGMFIHNGPVTQWGTDIGWPLVCTTLPCTVPGPKNVPRNLTTTDELAAHRREYFDLAKTWDPKDFNATALARRAKDAGMKYVVYTTVHCDGFANWPSKVATYNVETTPFARDFFGELAAALRAAGLKLAENYAPDIFWFDCHNAPPWDTRLDAVAPAIRAANPRALVLTRNGVFSDYLELPDQSEAAVLQGVLDYQSFSGAPFEVASVLQASKQWAYDPASAQKPANLVIANLMLIRAKGGNYLLDVSPTPEGPAASADGVLAELAAWMAVNGEALHGAAPAYPYSDGASAFYTSKAAGDGLALYVMVPTTKPAGELPLPAPAAPSGNVTVVAARPTLTSMALAKAELLGFGEITAVAADAGLVLPIPAEASNLAFAKNGLVFKLHYAAV
ncbi:alpha-L-fucosidase [Aureococcus anophagefferens]|nr:alpha-L-fucosidase [Aureococcus anophagefferens]